jgi:hypothetical protein
LGADRSGIAELLINRAGRMHELDLEPTSGHADERVFSPLGLSPGHQDVALPAQFNAAWRVADGPGGRD